MFDKGKNKRGKEGNEEREKRRNKTALKNDLKMIFQGSQGRIQRGGGGMVL